MTLSWAWVETSLAMIIGLIIEYNGPIDGCAEAPVSLKKKLQFFRKSLRSIEALKPFQERGTILAERIGHLGSSRNNLVHGASWQIHEGSFHALGLKAAGAQYAPQNHTFNVDDTIALNVEIGALSDDITIFMVDVARMFEGSPGGKHGSKS